MVYIKILSSATVFTIDNDEKCFRAPNQHIRMISEGSCDSEDFSFENSALPLQQCINLSKHIFKIEFNLKF